MSATPAELAAFIKAALERGIPRPQIQAALQNAGWTQDQIRDGIGSFAETEFAIPVPRPRPYLDARDAFMYLLLFSMLFMSAYHLGSLLFEIINAALPDPASPSRTYREGSRMAIRWSISALLVACPLFLYVSRLVAREVAADPSKRQSKVRRWLTYLTLFIAATTLVGDAIALIFNLLGGELTTRFILKVLVVGFIAGAGFWYYMTTLEEPKVAAGA